MARGAAFSSFQTRGRPAPSRPSLPRAFLTNFGSSSPFGRHFRVWKPPSCGASRGCLNCCRPRGPAPPVRVERGALPQGGRSRGFPCRQQGGQAARGNESGERTLPPRARGEQKGWGAAAVSNEESDNRSLEEILGSISPPPPPAMTNEAGAPRLMITHIVNQNFKSYAGEQTLGPFHKRFSCIIGPNGSGKSNVIDAMLFVFGYRAQKIRSKKLSVLIHNSEEHTDIQSCSVQVHFQKIIDKEGDDYEVIPNSNFCVSRTAYRDNSSVYHINGKKSTFKDVGILLRSHGIDLDHNRFLILQGEVEQIAMMKPKGQTEHDEGMLEYLEDLIGSARLRDPIQTLCRRVETLNEQRGEKLNRVKMVEKEKDALEGDKNKAIEFLSLENKMFKEKNLICQYYIYDLQKRINDLETQKENIQKETKDINEKSSKLADEMKSKSKALKDLEKKIDKITTLIEENKNKFTQLDLQDVKVREKLKHAKSKAKKLEKQLQKDKEKGKEKELMEFCKTVNDARSRMDVAQAELDIYLTRYNTAVSQLNEAKEALMTTSETLKQRKAAIKDIDIKLPTAELELKEKENKLEKLKEEELSSRDLVRNLRQKVEEAKSSLAQHRSRGKVLEALLEQKRSGSISGIHGRLGDLGAIDEKYDVAISSSCAALDYIVVDTIDIAQECVEFLKKTEIGAATFIALDKMAVWKKNLAKIPTPENAPRLIDLVKVKDESFCPAFYFALRDTLVVKNLEDATRIAFQRDKRWRVVTLKGEIIEQSGTMTGGGGKVMKGRMGSSVVADVSPEEINRLESELQRDSKRAVQCEEEKVQLEEDITKLQKNVREMRNTLEKYTASIQSFSEQETRLKGQVKELEANVAAAAPDKSKQKELEKVLNYERVSEQSGKMESEVKRLHNLIIDFNNRKLKTQQDKVDKINQEIDECSSTITKAQVAIKTAHRNLKKSEDSVLRTEKEIGDNEKEIKDLTEELTMLEDKATAVLNDCKQAEEALPAVQEEHRSLLQEMRAIQDDEHELRKEALNIKFKIEQIESHISTHQSKVKYWQKEVRSFSVHRNGCYNSSSPGKHQLTTQLRKSFTNSFCFSVRPPKKSWKKIFNLSGGEKTLSSLALVFALHHYKPTPLYFMDEIDAALDFKNVSIVAFYIYVSTGNSLLQLLAL
uniref:Structural maintenance of chromosomes 4 n=1 Tax=Pavo cristatus TaxID=9049 RepID=A0A8C9FT42_PAVCR